MYAAGMNAAVMSATMVPMRRRSDIVMPGGKFGPWNGHPEAIRYRTRSIGGPFGGVMFEREMDLSPPHDDEIIIVTVRVSNSFRRLSAEGGNELPSRPRPRNFIRRLSSRVSTSPEQGYRYTAIKMPRRDYKQWFARDKNGNYAGTEPERDWDDTDLRKQFGEYQEMPLRSIPGASQYGEGDVKGRNGSEVLSEEGEDAAQRLEEEGDIDWWEQKAQRGEGAEGVDEEWWK